MHPREMLVKLLRLARREMNGGLAEYTVHRAGLVPENFLKNF
jgi:hypothetical protein